jgi:hypothetical protein
MLALAFTLGVFAGFVLAVIAAIVVLNWPVPERTEAPRYSAIGAGRVHESSRPIGSVPSDWNPIWP